MMNHKIINTKIKECGHPGIIPKPDASLDSFQRYDKKSTSTIFEITWQCYHCGAVFQTLYHPRFNELLNRMEWDLLQTNSLSKRKAKKAMALMSLNDIERQVLSPDER